MASAANLKKFLKFFEKCSSVEARRILSKILPLVYLDEQPVTFSSLNPNARSSLSVAIFNSETPRLDIKDLSRTHSSP